MMSPSGAGAQKSGIERPSFLVTAMQMQPAGGLDNDSLVRPVPRTSSSTSSATGNSGQTQPSQPYWGVTGTPTRSRAAPGPSSRAAAACGSYMIGIDTEALRGDVDKVYSGINTISAVVQGEFEFNAGVTASQVNMFANYTTRIVLDTNGLRTFEVRV